MANCIVSHMSNKKLVSWLGHNDLAYCISLEIIDLYLYHPLMSLPTIMWINAVVKCPGVGKDKCMKSLIPSHVGDESQKRSGLPIQL